MCRKKPSRPASPGRRSSRPSGIRWKSWTQTRSSGRAAAQLLGKQPVHLAIDPVPLMVERGQVDPIVEQRPQGAIGHAAIVAGIFRFGQIQQRIGDLAVLDLRSAPGRPDRPPCLPLQPEPDAAFVAQRRQHADRQPAGLAACRPVGGVTRLETTNSRPPGISRAPAPRSCSQCPQRPKSGRTMPGLRLPFGPPTRTLTPPRALTARSRPRR